MTGAGSLQSHERARRDKPQIHRGRGLAGLGVYLGPGSSVGEHLGPCRQEQSSL